MWLNCEKGDVPLYSVLRLLDCQVNIHDALYSTYELNTHWSPPKAKHTSSLRHRPSCIAS